MREWQRSECIVFWKTGEAYGWLSNMSRYPLRIDLRYYPTSEHYYIALKYGGEHWDLVDEILHQPNPVLAKRLSYQSQHLWRPDWGKLLQVAAMRKTLRLKYDQHPELVQQLLATGDTPIVEASSHDAWWGAMPPTAPILRGENILGRLHMEYRHRARTETR